MSIFYVNTMKKPLLLSPQGSLRSHYAAQAMRLVAPQLVAIPNMVTMLKLHMLAQPALGGMLQFSIILTTVPYTLLII